MRVCVHAMISADLAFFLVRFYKHTTLQLIYECINRFACNPVFLISLLLAVFLFILTDRSMRRRHRRRSIN